GYDRRGRIGSAAQPRKPLPGALVALRCQELAVPAGVQGRSAGQVPDAHSSDRRSVDRSTITRIENKFGRAIPRTKSVFDPLHGIPTPWRRLSNSWEDKILSN